jgi:hypothetical protein
MRGAVAVQSVCGLETAGSSPPHYLAAVCAASPPCAFATQPSVNQCLGNREGLRGGKGKKSKKV